MQICSLYQHFSQQDSNKMNACQQGNSRIIIGGSMPQNIMLLLKTELELYRLHWCISTNFCYNRKLRFRKICSKYSTQAAKGEKQSVVDPALKPVTHDSDWHSKISLHPGSDQQMLNWTDSLLDRREFMPDTVHHGMDILSSGQCTVDRQTDIRTMHYGQDTHTVHCGWTH